MASVSSSVGWLCGGGVGGGTALSQGEVNPPEVGCDGSCCGGGAPHIFAPSPMFKSDEKPLSPAAGGAGHELEGGGGGSRAAAGGAGIAGGFKVGCGGAAGGPPPPMPPMPPMPMPRRACRCCVAAAAAFDVRGAGTAACTAA